LEIESVAEVEEQERLDGDSADSIPFKSLTKTSYSAFCPRAEMRNRVDSASDDCRKRITNFFAQDRRMERKRRILLLAHMRGPLQERRQGEDLIQANDLIHCLSYWSMSGPGLPRSL
jgi:hypothetical protein